MKKKYLFLTMFFIIGITFFVLAKKKNDTQSKYERNTYIPIDQSNLSFQGVVNKVGLSNVLNGSLLIDLTNGEHLRSYKMAQNNNYMKKNFYKFLQIGDSIYKPSHSDSIYVYRNNKEYYFILGGSIN